MLKSNHSSLLHQIFPEYPPEVPPNPPQSTVLELTESPFMMDEDKMNFGQLHGKLHRDRVIDKTMFASKAIYKKKFHELQMHEQTKRAENILINILAAAIDRRILRHDRV